MSDEFTIEEGKKKVSIRLMILLGIFSHLPLLFLGTYFTLPDEIMKYVIYAFGLNVAAIACAGMFITGMIRIYMVIEDKRYIDGTSMIKNYFRLKNYLSQFLNLTGFIFTLGVCVVTLLRKAIVAYHGGNNTVFPQEAVEVFGLVYTFFIAIVYVPTHLKLAALAEQIVNREGKLDGLDWKAKSETQQTIENYLGFRVKLADTLKVAIPILAPLLSGLLPGVKL